MKPKNRGYFGIIFGSQKRRRARIDLPSIFAILVTKMKEEDVETYSMSSGIIGCASLFGHHLTVMSDVRFKLLKKGQLKKS